MADTIYEVTSGFYDSVGGDRLYSAEQMNMPYKKLVGDGVYANSDGSESDDFSVSEYTGMIVKVSPGNAIVGGKWAENSDDMEVEVAGNSASYARIDSIILRVNKNLSARAAGIVYRQGTAAATPAAPDLDTASGVTELRLANITVGVGVTEITAANITDTRGGTECPWVSLTLSPGSITSARIAAGAVTENKLAAALLKKTVNAYVTPEMYGAAGDGQTDDTAAVQLAIDSNPGKTILFSGTYKITATIETSATDSEKVFLQGVNGGRLVAGAGFSGTWAVDLCGGGTRTSVQNTEHVTGIEGLIIDTAGRCGGILIERCHMARISNCTIMTLGAYTGVQIEKPSEADGVNSSDAYVDNLVIFGADSNVESCTGMIINGHDNDVRNVRPNFVNIGIVINGSHNRVSNAHPLRGAADDGYTVYETSKAFVVGNNNIYLKDCYSDNFAVGIDVSMPGAIFFAVDFTLLWWESYNVTHTFIKLEDSESEQAANKLFWGHVRGADLLYKAVGTNKGVDGSFLEASYARNANCFTGLYINNKGTLPNSDALLDLRFLDVKVDDYNYSTREVADLAQLYEGTTGRALFPAETSPNGQQGIYIYEVIGDSTRKIIRAYNPATKQRYINSYAAEGWTGWDALT